ncbi:MAG: hypothetical protein KAH18_03995 [Psychromonas sp.]|nr:hypothetical protein [Psychromonas sp.]
MALYDTQQVTDLLKQFGANAPLLADAFINGSVSSDDISQLKMLHKKGLLRPNDAPGEYRVASEVNRMLNRLMCKQSSYLQLTDMGKVIDSVNNSVADHQLSIKNNQHDDANYYLEQIDDLLYQATDSLNVSLDTMHSFISSKFGFVATLSAKIRENEKMLNYAQKLLTELQQIDPESCYEWTNWPCSSDFSRKISGFIYWFNQALPRLRFIIDNMRLSLFRLRCDEKQANLLRKMARYLHSHPEFELSDALFNNENLPSTLKFSPPLQLKTYVDLYNTANDSALIDIIQSLRTQKKPSSIATREVSEVDIIETERIDVKHDFFEDETQRLFEQVIIDGHAISAINFMEMSLSRWGDHEHIIDPIQWVELVFSSYCKLTHDQQSFIQIKPKAVLLEGTTANYIYSDIVIKV